MRNLVKFSKSVQDNSKLFLIALLLININVVKSQPASSESGWQLTGYSFKDGTSQNETVLAGTSSKMKNVVSYKGDKGSIEITQNRFDVNSGKLLAGVTYSVNWTDPPAILVPGEKSFLDYEINTISSLTWKAPQQSINLNQGLYGIYFVTPDGTKYFTKDFKSRLTTEKPIEKGSKGTKRIIQMNFGNGFSATYTYEWKESITIDKPETIENKDVTGWHFTNYSFKDGTLQNETVLAGTSSKMKNAVSYKGDKGSIEITQNRFDVNSGKLLAGVTYMINWTDPPATLIPGEKCFMEYEVKTISSLTWKAPQQSIKLNQGLYGIYFVTPDGMKYFTKDFKSGLTTEKAIEKGSKGMKKNIQVNFGNGFSATYNYEWKEF